MSVNIEVLNEKKIDDIIYFVKSNETLLSVATKFCVKLEDLAKDNDLRIDEEIDEGDILWIRKRNTAIHIVKPLETLEQIANKYNVTVEHIKKINNIEKVFIGQNLII